MQALAARHGISLTQIGRSLIVTTGRQLRQGWPRGASDVVVMLDAHCSFRKLDDEPSIYWGAFLGTDDEILISGTIGECGDNDRRGPVGRLVRKGGCSTPIFCVDRSIWSLFCHLVLP